jgi:hypothetical protein
MAKKETKSSKKKPSLNEIGTRSGYTSIYDEYQKEERRQDEIPISDYRKMRTNDGKVSALVSLYTLPIWRMSFNVEPTNGDRGEAEFIMDNFTKPFGAGGTDRSFEYYIRDMAYFIFDGFRAYEKVWYIDEENKVRLKKLALRDAETVTILSDKDELRGLKQGEVVIPKEKTLLLTYNPSEDMFYGQSILRPVWYHWDKKHKLYYIAHVAAEVQTVPPRVLKHKGMDSAQLSKLENALDRLGLESRITYNSNNAEVEFLDVTSGTKVNIIDMIQHHDNQMAKAMLAMWVDLSSEGNAAGSRALGSPMIDIYEQNIESITQIIENEINVNVIPQLIDWNFASKNYPKFRFSPLDQQSEGLIRQAFVEIVRKGLPDELTMDIIGKIAKRFDIEFDAEEQLKLLEQKKEEQKKMFQTQNTFRQRNDVYKSPDEKGMQNNVNVAQKKKLNKLSEQDIVNLADEANGRINLMDFADKIENGVEELNEELGELMAKMGDEVLVLFINAILNKDYDALEKIGLNHQTEYQDEINSVLKEIYNYAKLKASEEIEIKTPATPDEAIKKIILNTKNIVDKQFADLMSAIISLAIVGISKGWDRNKAEISFGTLLNDFKREKMELGNEQMVMETFNDARNDVFTKNPGIVVGYKYNNSLENIMRGTVCPYCEQLHGLTVEFDSPAFYDYMPPQHFRCYDKDTEVYTDKGWVFFKNLIGGEKIWSLNPETQIPEWVGYKHKVEYKYTGQMAHYKNNQFDLMVTPDHNQYVQFRNKKKGRVNIDWQILKDNSLPNNDFRFFRSANWIGQEPEMIKINDRNYPTLPLARFMGWYLSEGNVTKRSEENYQIMISQQKIENIPIILADIAGLFDNIHTWKRGVGIIGDTALGEYLIGFGKSDQKFIPDWIKELSPRYIEEFLRCYRLGDGYVQKGKVFKGGQFKNTNNYFTSSTKMAEGLGELIMKVGKRPWFGLDKTAGKRQKFSNGEYIINNDTWRIGERRQIYSMVGRTMQRELVDYSDMVYDVELEKNHVLLVRRGAQVVWSGNCACFWEAVRSNDEYEISPIPNMPVYDTINDFRGLSEEDHIPLKLSDTKAPAKVDDELLSLIEELTHD